MSPPLPTMSRGYICFFKQSCVPLLVAGGVFAAYGTFRALHGQKDALTGILLLAAILFAVIPLAANWKLVIDAPSRKLHLHRWFRTVVVDLPTCPIAELNLLESNTERGLWFIQLVSSDGRGWILPSSFTKHHETIATNIRSCCPHLKERRSDLASNILS